MKKTVMVVALAAVIIFVLLGSLAFTDNHQYVIDTKISNRLPKPMQEGSMLEKAKDKYGFSKSLNQEEPRLYLALTTEQPNPSYLVFDIKGDGFLKFGQSKFPFKINEKRSYLKQITYNNKPILAGLIVKK